MEKELNNLLTKARFGVAEDIAKNIFNNVIECETQEELNIKSALLKQAFLNQFELAFETEFLNASDSIGFNK